MSYECDDKMVSHPDHYKGKNEMEVIDVINEFVSHLQGMKAYDIGNVVKYMLRWKKKNGVQDLKKAAWYLDHLIEENKLNIRPLCPVKKRYATISEAVDEFTSDMSFVDTIYTETILTYIYYWTRSGEKDFLERARIKLQEMIEYVESEEVRTDKHDDRQDALLQFLFLDLGGI